jgi:mRNA interferase MazF
VKEGSIVLTSLLQADGRTKNRPALILREMPPFKDFLVCGISTQLHLEVEGFDEVILKSDVDFPSSGLLEKSLVRLGFLALLPRRNVIGAIGSISPERHVRLLENLSKFLIQ